MNPIEAQPHPTGTPATAGSFRRFWRDPRLHQLIRWCLPALLIGLALRVAVTADMPYGYTQYDSADFLTTPRMFLTHHGLHINGKRSFLTPVLFSIPFFLPFPALLVIPAAQHVMGLIGILVTGAIVRLWFKRWKWFIIPATLLVGVNPMIIWYEHTLLGEAQYEFCALVAALAGTVWFRNPSRRNFWLFMLSLILVTGTRLEGKLFFCAALALIPVVFWGRWRQMLRHGAIALVLTVLGFIASGARDGTPLLLATLIHLAPDHFQSVPELEPYLLPLRDELRSRFPEYPGDMVKTSKRIDEAVDNYLDSNPELIPNKEAKKSREESLRKALCVEILKNQPREVLALPLLKSRLAIDAWSAYCWNDHYLHKRQWEALTLTEWMAPVLSKGLTGKLQTDEELKGWVAAHFDAKRIQWFTDYQEFWNDAILYFRTPDRPTSPQRWVHDFFGGVPGGLNTVPGVPYFYPLVLLGMAAAISHRRGCAWFHLMWIGCMLFIWYAAMMVGVTNARFRFAYEPFCFLYFLLLFDVLLDTRTVRTTLSRATEVTSCVLKAWIR
ncbi:MAG: hypothetical protein WCH57_07985 [Verrucomicrobiota bacterium]